MFSHHATAPVPRSGPARARADRARRSCDSALPQDRAAGEHEAPYARRPHELTRTRLVGFKAAHARGDRSAPGLGATARSSRLPICQRGLASSSVGPCPAPRSISGFFAVIRRARRAAHHRRSPRLAERPVLERIGLVTRRGLGARLRWCPALHCSKRDRGGLRPPRPNRPRTRSNDVSHGSALATVSTRHPSSVMS
jgi:hypothetical protein